VSSGEQHFLAGLSHHKAGHADEAERCYRAALALEPEHFKALQHLGAIAVDRGDFAGAAALFEKAAHLNPADPVVFYQLASSLVELERYGEALAAFDAAIALKSDVPRLHAGRGGVLHALQRTDEAIAAYDAALALRPNDALTLSNRAAALQLAGRNEAALRDIERSLALRPDDPKSLVQRAVIRLDRSETDKALADFEHALRLQPDNTEIAMQLGAVLMKCNGTVRAIEVYSEVVARDRSNVDAFAGRGGAYYLLHRHDQAIADFDAALALEPQSATHCYNRANALAGLNRHEEALADIERALALEPSLADAMATRFSIVAARCDFSGRDRAGADLVSACRGGKYVYPYVLLYAVDDPGLHLATARNAAGPSLRPRPRLVVHDRLRIGYLSADLRNHVVAHQFVEVLERHDRRGFETIGISLSPGDDSPMRRRIVKAFDRFVESGDCSDGDLARLIARLDLDIVVDLTGHTERGRTKALKERPAPVAVNFLGYPGTLGADYVDYVIADAAVIPPEAEAFYAEKIVRLPFSFMPRDTTIPPGSMPSRAAAGLPPTGIVFGAFANPYKIDPTVFAVWMDLLKAVTDSVLWLNVAEDAARANLHGAAAAHGVDPTRLVFAERLADNADYLGRLKRIDVFLDTACYGAHATASDVLWAGVPLVTVSGRSFATRVGASMLKFAGLAELAATDLAAYRAIALGLAENPERRAAIRAHLDRERTRLFDMGRFARALESAYRTMMDQARDGRRAGFTVSA